MHTNLTHIVDSSPQTGTAMTETWIEKHCDWFLHIFLHNLNIKFEIKAFYRCDIH